jgi:hypothetical protein
VSSSFSPSSTVLFINPRNKDRIQITNTEIEKVSTGSDDIKLNIQYPNPKNARVKTISAISLGRQNMNIISIAKIQNI